MASSTAPVALVTGGSRGLGLLIATRLAELGHRVAVCARDQEQTARGARLAEARARRSTGDEAGSVSAFTCDVTDRDSVAALVAEVEADLGPVDVLMHVAGIIQVGPAETMTLEHFDAAVGTMLFGAVNTTWAVLPRMRERGHGRIGIVTSIGGKLAAPHMLPYTTAKFGAVGFTEGLAAELAGTGVTATTLVPGLMRTGSPDNALFTGDAAAEFAWFGLSASLPVLSMDATRAAHRMVDATLAGKPVLVLTPMAQVGMRVHGLAPATTVRALGLVNRLLPSAPQGSTGGTGSTGSSEAITGLEAGRRLGRTGQRVVKALGALGQRAGDRLNQRPATEGS